MITLRRNDTWAALSAVLMIGLCSCAASAGAKKASPALPDHLRLVCRFDESLYACEGAANPYPAAGRIKLVAAGAARGKVARFEGHDAFPAGRARSTTQKSSMVFDGTNLPVERGTVGFWMRFSGKRHWADGKRTWLLVLLPAVRNTLKTKGDGTALVLFKEADNTLALGEYQLHNGRPRHDLLYGSYDPVEPAAFPIKIPVADRKPGEWAHVRLAWDMAAGRVWVGLDDTLKSAAVTFRKAPWRCLLVGTPSRIVYVKARGFDGDVDDLIVDARTPAQAAGAGRDLPGRVPPVAKAPNDAVPAVYLKDSPLGEKMESIVRSHLQLVLSMQQHGGWAYSAAWPSRMWFSSAKVIVPSGKHAFIGSKDGNSAFVALMVMAGYMALGEKAYLEAAERAGQAFIQLQYPDGHWPYGANFNPATGKFETMYAQKKAPLEDHVQSHPIALLWLLHDLTGKPEYKATADKGLAFILKAQNPNGSWSLYYDTKAKCGRARRGQLRAGEINDDATGDQMTIALIAYRRTGDVKYLAAYLRGADWLVSAFVDEKAKGWAQQYDEHNKPIEARHFEPPAVSLSEGIQSAPLMLMRTYRMTGDRRYLEPVYKWKQWMWDNRVFVNKEKTRWGWHTYYDPVDGKAFRMLKRKKMPANPRRVRDGGYTHLLRMVGRVERPVKPVKPSIQRAQRLLRATEGPDKTDDEAIKEALRALPLVRSFDWQAGTWLYGRAIPRGPGFSCATVRVALVAWSVFLRRQVRGQIPLDHRMSPLSRNDWANPFYYLVPPPEMAKRLAPDEIRRAREHIKSARNVPQKRT